MEHSLSARVLIIPVVSAAAALALVALTFMPAPDRAFIDRERGKDLPLSAAAPVPAPRP